MASVSFGWSPLLVELRRQFCPRARWQKASRQWFMGDDEATSFVRAAQAALEFQRTHAQIRVDGDIWVVGFVEGAPYRLGQAEAA